MDAQTNLTALPLQKEEVIKDDGRHLTFYTFPSIADTHVAPVTDRSAEEDDV